MTERTDAERVEWIERTKLMVKWVSKYNLGGRDEWTITRRTHEFVSCGLTWRQAIDTAMDAEGEESKQ